MDSSSFSLLSYVLRRKRHLQKKPKRHLYNFKKAIKLSKAFLWQHNVRNRNNHLYVPIRKCECYSMMLSSTSFPDHFLRHSHFEVKTLGTSLRFLLLPHKPSVQHQKKVLTTNFFTKLTVPFCKTEVKHRL